MEEDIKILEEMLKTRKEQKEIIECAGGYCGNCNPDIKALENAIQTMKAYKELEEENEALKIKNNFRVVGTLAEQKLEEVIKNDYIPVSLVEETIQELNKEEQELQRGISDEEREEYSDANISFELMNIEIKRSVLQELLEKRK